MVIILTSIIVLASVLLVFVVYVQNPKGGGLSSDFGAAQQIGGVQKTNDFIDKATWSLAGIIGVVSVILTIQTMSPALQRNSDKDKTEDTNQQGQNPQGQQKPQGQQRPAQPQNQ